MSCWLRSVKATFVLVFTICTGTFSASGAAPAPGAAGAYLMPLTGCVLVVAPNPTTGELAANQIGGFTLYDWGPVKFGNGSLTIECREGAEYRAQMGAGESPFASILTLNLSQALPGDWDLALVTRTRKGVEVERSPDGPPIVGYLHRLEDGDAAYFEMLARAIKRAPRNPRMPAMEDFPALDPASAGQLVSAASVVLARNDADAGWRLVYLDALARAGKFDELERRLGQWGPELRSHANPAFGMMADRASRAVESARCSAAGRNGADFAVAMFGPSGSLSERLAAAPRILSAPDYRPPVRALFRDPLPLFLTVQTISKVARTEATFDLMRGDRQRALEINAAVYRFGQGLEQGEQPISVLLGIALRRIACGGVELQILNACEEPDEAKRVFETLEQLRGFRGATTWEETRGIWGTAFGLRARSDPHWGRSIPEELLEAETRYLLSDASFELIRAAAAARYSKMFDGEYPATGGASFGPLMPRGIGTDPFGGAPLRHGAMGDAFAVWSLGPDQDDDKATIIYDPTNGTISDGDISIVIPATRKYPFPREGFHPRRPQDVEAVFPGGLPVDVFADTRLRPLTVVEGEQLRIFSFGPDTDEERHRSHPSECESQPQYDPTNGTISAGNLYYRPRE